MCVCHTHEFFVIFMILHSLLLEVGNSVEVQLNVSESSTGPCEEQHAVILGAS